MAKPQLQSNGLLSPGIHPCNEAEMEAALVTDFPTSKSRSALFDWWGLHRQALSEILPPQKQWIDGSFVTNKVDPGDIDVATFLSGPAFDQLPRHQQVMLRALTLGKYTRELWRMDSYQVVEYPVGHPNRALYEKTRDYWESLFGQTRQGQPKGFLEV
jgi:Family of unknown function (DUF6932)